MCVPPKSGNCFLGGPCWNCIKFEEMKNCGGRSICSSSVIINITIKNGWNQKQIYIFIWLVFFWWGLCKKRKTILLFSFSILIKYELKENFYIFFWWGWGSKLLSYHINLFLEMWDITCREKTVLKSKYINTHLNQHVSVVLA